MTPLAALYSIRRYGIKGIIDFILNRPKAAAFRRELAKTMGDAPPSRGVTLIACFDKANSLSKVMRDIAIMLKETRVPYQTLNLPCEEPIPNEELESFMTPRDEFSLNKYTNVLTMMQPLEIPDRRCHVHCIEFWEFDDGFLGYRPEALQCSEVLALSDFNLSVFKRTLPSNINVRKVLYPFQFKHGNLRPISETRTKYHVGSRDFMIFFNFDYGCSYYRKNPEGVLHAFSRSLASKPDAKIVFKTMRAKQCKAMNDQLHGVAKELGITDNLITIDDFIPQEDLVNLTNACDVYMSLHRGEGFGLGIAEAMSLGKPVIVTNYSAPTEYCNKENSILVPYTMVPIKPHQYDIDAYHHVSLWPEPDVDSAAAALESLYKNTQLRKEIGNRAKLFIESYFSPSQFKKSINALLDATNSKTRTTHNNAS